MCYAEGERVKIGTYLDEEEAARSYDLHMYKKKGPTAELNFDARDYKASGPSQDVLIDPPGSESRTKASLSCMSLVCLTHTISVLPELEAARKGI